jgi:DTW domain-containing protein
MEYRHKKSATGRLTQLCLADSEIQVGIEFDSHAAVQALINDPEYYPVLLYPGPNAFDLSAADLRSDSFPLAKALRESRSAEHPDGKRLLVFLLDATWDLAKKTFNLSPSLQALPRLKFTPSVRSRYVIKRQPAAFCLSTLEAVHELLLALEKAGLDSYPDKDQLLNIFTRMQDYQIACSLDPSRRHFERSKGPSKDYLGMKAAWERDTNREGQS